MRLSSFDAFKHAYDDNAIIIEGDLLRQCQKMQLEITDDVVSVCEKYGINYTLGGGSALGAVRHGGMIPWDDDIDINIFRPDYDLFLDVMRREYSEKYWIHTPEHTHNYGLLFIQIRKKGTIMRGREDTNIQECGIGIDVFPYENTYSLKPLRIAHGILCMGMKFGLSCKKTWDNRELNMKLAENDSEAKKTIALKSAIGRVCSVFSTDAWTHGTIRLCKIYKNNKSKYVAIPSGRKQFLGEIYKRAEVEDTEKVPFDGRYYRLTKAYDGYLRNLYGDYMQMPPEESREHHVVYELDLGDK